MNELLKALSDNQHLVVVAGMAWGYFKLRGFRRAELEDARRREIETVELTKRVIKESLSNGIGETMKRLIDEHQKVEEARLRDVMADVHHRLERVEAGISELMKRRGWLR